jgi:glycerophosphoryl diester phosphodiesterase
VSGERVNPLLDSSARPVIGHRGAAAYAPENTLESFRLALAMGADALEFDVRRSADGEAVVVHDATLDRTTNLAGPVASRTVAELRGADAGFRFANHDGETPFRRRGVSIPTLAEVIAAFPGVPLLIEVKEVEAQAAIARALIEGGAAERAVVAGSNHRALEVFRSDPFTVGASQRDIARLYFGVGAPHPRCRAYAVPDHYYGLPVPTRRFVRAARCRASTVHVWTVDDARTAIGLWQNEVNGIVTNRPDVIVAARKYGT